MTRDTAQRGFTLLESLVAIAIFTVGVSAAVFVITQSLNVGARTKDKIIAAHLASEGIEVVRNIRDRNWLAGRVWDQGISTLNNACLQWDTDYNTIDVSCTSGANVAFDGMHYVQTTAQSQFSRTISTQAIFGNPDELKVTSAVSCGTGCAISLDEYLYNWK